MNIPLEDRISMAVNRQFDAKIIEGGLGEEVDEGGDPLSELSQSEKFKKAREKVTPFIWVLSSFGFLMALLNTHRIKKIFKSWKGAREYAKGD